MELLRQQPFPLTLIIPDPLPDGHEYDVLIANEQTEHGDTVVSVIKTDKDDNPILDENGDPIWQLEIPLPNYPFSFYDEDYSISISSTTTGFTWNSTQTQYVEDLYVRRPLWEVDPDNEDEVMLEQMVRYLIDAITGGFYYRREWIEGQGLGTDFYPTPDGTREVMEGFENNVHVFSKYNTSDTGTSLNPSNPYPYEMTRDMTAITIETNFQRKSVASKQVKIKHGMSDSYATNQHWKRPYFPNGFYYHFLLGIGYQTLPSDIILAAQRLKKLLGDIPDSGGGGGSLPGIGMLPAGLEEYSTDQFKLVFNSEIAGDATESTGDRYVDAILDKYKNKAGLIDRLGVL
jgi:hypothetical protein